MDRSFKRTRERKGGKRELEVIISLGLLLCSLGHVVIPSWSRPSRKVQLSTQMSDKLYHCEA